MKKKCNCKTNVVRNSEIKKQYDKEKKNTQFLAWLMDNVE